MKNEMKKIKIARHGISPLHYFLENNLSWNFSVKGLNEKAGKGSEDALMADFLNCLDFLPRDFLNKLFEKATWCKDNPNMPIHIQDDAEIRGNAGNYWYPGNIEKKGVRLGQPDGWIADASTVILLEAKGYGSGASVNDGQ